MKRDLDYMRERFNAPIEYDREANGYRFGAPRTGPRALPRQLVCRRLVPAPTPSARLRGWVWHPKQRARFEEGGSYVLEIPYANDRELLMEIRKLGADVEVLAPDSLRTRVAESLKQAARRYE